GGQPRAGHRDIDWWRSGRATRAATLCPHNPTGHATRSASSPGARPQRPASSRGSGSSGTGAPAGRGRLARGMPPARLVQPASAATGPSSDPRTSTPTSPALTAMTSDAPRKGRPGDRTTGTDPSSAPPASQYADGKAPTPG